MLPGVWSVIVLAIVWLWSPPADVPQPAPNRAALVVADDRGNITKRCVTFTEASITGLELLQRAGLAVTIKYSGGGAAVCSIGGYGCSYPQQDCFCKCQGAWCEYWAYWHWNDGAWRFSGIGASGYTVRGGALEGWAWGAGSFGASGALPPAVTFDELCAPPHRLYLPLMLR